MAFIDHAFFISAVVGGLLIVALLSRRDNRRANILLGMIIAAAICFQYVASLKVTGEIFDHPLLWRTPLPIAVFINTLLYLYILSLTVPGFKISQVHFAYYVPLIVSLIWYVVLQMVPRTSPLWVDPQIILLERYCRAVFAFLIKSLFLFLCFQQLYKYRQHVKLYFSELRHVRLKWLEYLLILFAVPWLVRGFDLVTGPYLTIERIAVPLISVSVLVIGYLGLRQSVIFTSDDESVKEIYASPQALGQSGSWSLKSKHEIEEKGLTYFNETELQQWIAKLKKYMTEKKPYLNPELRLVDLAKGLRIKGYMVSEILNRGLGESFYSFINGYRVTEAKDRLKDPLYEHMNILGIATDSGFNSKSVFNEVFRKTTGITPSEFRKDASLVDQVMTHTG